MGKTNNVKELILEKMNKEDYCLVIGSDEMIDDFSKSFGANVGILMGDFKIQDKIKSEPIRVFNSDTKEILIFGLAKKKEMKDIIEGLNIQGAKKGDTEDITAIMLQKGHNILTYHVKSDDEKIDLINAIFKTPDEKIRNEMIETMTSKDKRWEEEYIGYA